MPYGFNSKDKTLALSKLGNHLMSAPQGPWSDDPGRNYPIIGAPQHLMNDLRFRTKIVVVELTSNITPATTKTINVGLPEERDIWSAGQGGVRILHKYNETTDPPPNPPNNELGPWKLYFSGEGPGTPTADDPAIKYSTRETLAYNYLPQEISSDSGTSEPVRAICVEDIHGDLWVIAASQNKTKDIQPVEATTCIYPGQGGVVKLYDRQTDGTWAPTPSDTGTLVDPWCQVMALPGEVFWVDMATHPNLGNPTVYPIADHGLRRRVRATTAITCGATGTVKIRRQTKDNDCNWVDTTCEIDVCNNSSMKILCNTHIPHHDGWAHFTSDKHTDDSIGNCRWYIDPDYMAMEAKARLVLPLCTGQIEVGGIADVQFTDTCLWDEDLEQQIILNPLNRRACADKTVYLRRNMPDCQWEVARVEAVETNHYIGFEHCGDNDCNDLKGWYLEKAAVETCNCTQLSTTVLPMKTTSVGVGWRIDTGQGGGECNMIPQFLNVCTPDCNTNAVPFDGVPTVFQPTETLKSVRLVEGEGIYCTGHFIFSMCTPLPGNDLLCIPTEVCEDETPVEDI